MDRRAFDQQVTMATAAKCEEVSTCSARLWYMPWYDIGGKRKFDLWHYSKYVNAASKQQSYDC